jgi:hypothetical protein
MYPKLNNKNRNGVIATGGGLNVTYRIFELTMEGAICFNCGNYVIVYR